VSGERGFSFVKRTEIVALTQEHQIREDAHGGPGLYPREVVLAKSEEVIAYADLPHQLAVTKR
jgi:hypothetical protein